MIVVLSFSVIAVFFAFLDSKGKLKDGMKIGMIMMMLLAAIRYNYGNDYVSYFEDFKLMGKYSISDILFLQEKMQYVDAAFKDVGAAVLYRLCKPIGYFGFIAIVSILQGCIYYQLIKENVSRKYYWLAVFVYLFDFNNYVLQMTMIRQAFVMALFVWSWHFLRQGKYILPIIITLLSFTIHKSSIILVPFILLSIFSYKNGKAITLITLGVTAFLWVASTTIGNVIGNVMDLELFQLYNDTYGMEDGGKLGMARLLLALVPYFMALLYFINPSTAKGPRYLVFLSIVGTIMLPFSFVIPMMSRLTYYFNIFMIAAVPITAASFKYPIIKISTVGIFVILCLYQYFDLFLHSVYTKSYATFDTIFSSI